MSDSHNRPAITLVTMPLTAVERPSIALATLKALLRRDGLDAKVLYPNMWFLEYIGFDNYMPLYEARCQDAVVDWLFAGAAFPEFEPDHERYIERLSERTNISPPANWARLQDWLLDLRAQMPRFVDWVAQKIIGQQPRIVGCTSMFQQHVATLALLRRLRELDPSICTVIGGANCETVMGRSTHENFPWVDYVVSGEADDLATAFFTAILDKGREVAADKLPEGVFGPVHRQVGYPVIAGGDGLPRATVASLANAPMPDYDDYFEELDHSLYKDSISPGLPMETARGCWWGQKNHCTFCGLNGGGMNFRSKPPDQAFEEMNALAERHGVNKIETVDNILEMSYFETLLPRLADSPNDLLVFFETKSNLKRDQVELLARAGVRWIQPGIESLHSEILKLMRKGVGAWKNVQLLKWCRQYGIRVSWSVIAGFPGEKDEWYAEMADWLPLLCHLQTGYLNPLYYCRYSPYFMRPDDFGLDLKPSELYHYAYPLTNEQLTDQVYYFTDTQNPDVGRQTFDRLCKNRPGLTATRRVLREWRDNWQSEPVPVLSLCKFDDNRAIVDTRPCAVSERHQLSDLHYALLEACDAAPAPDKLQASFTERMKISDAAFDSALGDLKDRKLLVSLDGRILSLVLVAPVTPLLSQTQFPGGFMPKTLPPRYWEPASQASAQAAE